MSKPSARMTPQCPALHRIFSLLATVALASTALLLSAGNCRAQQAAAPAPASPPEKPLPGLDLSSMDLSADPCTDMYKYACGKFDANHPIPADLPSLDPSYVLYEINTQELSGILEKAEAGGAARSPDEQKIGDYFKACMNTDAINAAGLKPVQPLLDQIDALNDSPAGRAQLPTLIGKLQRYGVNAFFGYGEQQDFKDATKQIAFIQQGGLGLPEKDYYLRTGDKDVKLRDQYVAHVAKMLTLAGSTPEQAQKDAQEHPRHGDRTGQGFAWRRRHARAGEDLPPAAHRHAGSQSARLQLHRLRRRHPFAPRLRNQQLHPTVLARDDQAD